MAKPLHYLTTDLVNSHTAESLADSIGVSLEVADPRDLPRLEQQRARVVLDWDHLPADSRDDLLNGVTVEVVGVHGYNLRDSVARFLPPRGVVVGRQLDHAFVTALARRAKAA